MDEGMRGMAALHVPEESDPTFVIRKDRMYEGIAVLDDMYEVIRRTTPYHSSSWPMSLGEIENLGEAIVEFLTEQHKGCDRYCGASWCKPSNGS